MAADAGDEPGPRPSLPRRLEDPRKRFRRRGGRGLRAEPGAERPVEVVRAVMPRTPCRSRRTVVGIEGGAQRLVRATQAGLVGPHRDIEDRRGLCVSQAQVVMDDEDGPMVGRKSLEAALQLVPVRERARRVGDARRLDGVDGDLHRPRRARRDSSWQARTRSRFSQASKRSGSRTARICSHAEVSASWTASDARSSRRRIRRAMRWRRPYASVASEANASWSPVRARRTRSRCIDVPVSRGPVGRWRD